MTVRRWDARNSKAIGKSIECYSWVTDLTISTGGSVVVSKYGYKKTAQWNGETGEKIGEPIEAVSRTRELAVSNNGSITACGSACDDFVQQ